MSGVGAGVEGDVFALLLVHVAVGESRRDLLQEYRLETPTLEEAGAVHTVEKPRAYAVEGREFEGSLKGKTDGREKDGRDEGMDTVGEKTWMEEMPREEEA